MASVSSSRMGISHTRTSSVSKKGCGRMSHQIFLPLSMQLVLTSRSTKVSYSAQLAKTSGMLVRGKRSNTLQRYDLNPLFMPIQKGEFDDSARMCGRKYRMEFMMWMAVRSEERRVGKEGRSR